MKRKLFILVLGADIEENIPVLFEEFKVGNLTILNHILGSIEYDFNKQFLSYDPTISYQKDIKIW